VPNIAQKSFAGGELSPSLYARSDTVKYATGLRTMRNTWVRRDGGSQNRAGTQFISEIADSTSESGLIPFEFNDEQTYVLEFTDLVLRVWKAGVLQATLASPYAEADLSVLQFAQSADVLTFTANGYPVYELTRTSDVSWAFAEASVGSYAETGAIDTASLVAGGAGALVARYCITAVLEDGEETTPLFTSLASAYTVSGATKANPVVLTVVSTGGIVTGDLVYVEGVQGMREINGRYYRATIVSGTTLSIPVDGREFTTYTLGGAVRLCSLVDTTAATPTTANPDVINLPSIPDWYGSLDRKWAAFNIYQSSNGVFGYIGTTSYNSFSNTGFTPDTTISPPDVITFFDSELETPRCVGLLQQRRAFANFPTDTEKVVASQTGLYHKFTKTYPLVDSDAIVFRISGKKVGAVKHIVDVGQMLLFTSTGEYAALGNASGFITPSEVNLKIQSTFGCGDLAPIVIDGAAVFVQARGSIVRGISFNQDTGGFRGGDLTDFSKHLFDGHTIVDWAYQLVPHSIIWAVRDDGVLLGMTIVNDQQILAWHRHDFENGLVKNVCVVPEGNEDVLYLIIERVINGSTVKYLERMYTRYVDEDAVDDAVFMDSALTYDGWHAGATTMTLSGGTTWEYTESLTLTASAGYFTAGDVGNEIHLVGSDGTLLRCAINAYTSTTEVSVYPHKTVPAAMRSVAISEWAEAVDEVSGLDHLEGESVSIFADGFVVASPNNEAYTTKTVTAGVVNLGRCYAKVHVGLPITADVESLDIDTTGGQSMVDKNKLVSAVTVHLEKSRGGFFGPNNPDDNTRNTAANPLYGMVEIKPRNTEGYDSPADLKTGHFEIGILPEWNSNGRVFIRQVDPLPMSILAIVPSGLFGGG
jgi:hypothetical protein